MNENVKQKPAWQMPAVECGVNNNFLFTLPNDNHPAMRFACWLMRTKLRFFGFKIYNFFCDRAEKILRRDFPEAFSHPLRSDEIVGSEAIKLIMSAGFISKQQHMDAKCKSISQ